jgi:type I restriction enzyme S subunit
MKWEIKKFDDCIDKIIYSNKIGKKYFQNEGLYPIISQEKEFINGYWDEEKDLFKVDKPVVVFGDHTQVIKYIDFDFVLGADGVKILKPKQDIDSKYFYYFL